MENKEFLTIRGLDKRFAATHANKSINFSLARGEVRGLAGENGSGKSTLLSQIAGIYRPDGGTMVIDGEAYAPESPLDANDRGIAMVMQELGLVNALPASVNVFLGRTGKYSRFGFVSLKKIYAAACEEAQKWGLDTVPFHQLSGEMNVEGRKMVELTRALSVDPQILILDEVTQALSHDNRERLYRLIEKFRSLGRSIILISHDLEEMVELTDTISILRDGELLETVNSGEISIGELKSKMVGRKLDEDYYRQDAQEQYEDEVVLSARGVVTEDGLRDVSFDVHKGEILGFCGLSDSGIHEIGTALYGLSKLKSGAVELCGPGVQIKKQSQALANNMAYVPKDRDGDALMMSASIAQNFVMPSVGETVGKLGYLSEQRLTALARASAEQFNVKCTGVEQCIGELSGGNKQKVNLGRWLVKDLQVLIVDCPTRGVDVGVKAYLYQCLKEVKAQGIATVLITDELTEAIGMCDNIIVMKTGQIKTKIARSSGFSEESIIEVMI